MFADGPWMAIALSLYLLATLAAVAAGLRKRRFVIAMAMVAVALSVHGLAIALRWVRLDHGPYVNMYEILSSNVWSLHFAVLLAVLLIPVIRPMLATVLPVLQVLVIWQFTVPAPDSMVPVTYATVWLPVHVVVGKIFLGCLTVAIGLGLVILARHGGASRAFETMPASAALDELAYRFVMVAFVFQCLMLVVGAVWARDAWGRYWSWDPLETWAFITWLGTAIYLHLRVIRHPGPAFGAVSVLVVFGLAFFTFFGVPFVSTAPHKGAI